MKYITKTLSVLLMVAGLAACDAGDLAGPADAQPEAQSLAYAGGSFSKSNIFAISNGAMMGASTLGRRENAIGVSVKTSGIPNGQAVTLWWVVFNNPMACAASPCVEADLFNPAVKADILYADGAVVKNGALAFRANLKEGVTAGSIASLFQLPAASGLHDAEQAEVHVIVRSHGPVIPGKLYEQLSSFGGGCETELLAGTTPANKGECADLQFAEHEVQQD